MRGANLFAVVMIVCVALLACKKDKDKAKEAASAVASAQAPAPPPKYASGDVLKYVPKDCNEGRVFINVSKLFGPNKADLEKLKKSLLAGTDPDTKNAEKTLKVLEDAGFDPLRDIKEIAFCSDKTIDAVVAIGVDFDQVKGDPLDLVSKAVLAGGGDVLKKEKAATYSYLSKPNEKGVLALVTPTVLVFADNSSVAATAAQGGGASGFAAAGASLLYGAFEENGDQFTLNAAEQGTDVKLSLAVKPQTKKPEDLLTELQAMKLGALKEVEKSPMKDLGPDLKKVQFAVQGDQVTASLTLPRSRLTDLIKKASDMKPEEIMGAL